MYIFNTHIIRLWFTPPESCLEPYIPRIPKLQSLEETDSQGLEGEKLLGPKLSSLVMAFKLAISPDPLKALSHPCNPKRSVGRCPDGLCSFAHSGGAFCSPNVLGAAWMSFLGIFCSGHCNGFKGNHNKNTFHGVDARIRCRTCCHELTLMVNLQLWSLSQCSWREQNWKHSKIKRAYLHLLPHPAFTREAAQHSHFLSTCKLLLKLSFEADTMWPLASWFPKAWLYIFSGNMQHQGPFHLDSFVFCSSSHEVAWLGQGATHAVDSVIRWIGSNDWTCQACEVLDPSEFLASEECSAEEVPVIFGFPGKIMGNSFHHGGFCKGSWGDIHNFSEYLYQFFLACWRISKRMDPQSQNLGFANPWQVLDMAFCKMNAKKKQGYMDQLRKSNLATCFKIPPLKPSCQAHNLTAIDSRRFFSQSNIPRCLVSNNMWKKLFGEYVRLAKIAPQPLPTFYNGAI